MTAEERQTVVTESTRLMAAGFSLMERGDWEGAADLFSQAARQRESLPWRDDPDAAWMLAAAWINHGDAILRMEDPRRLAEAICSYDRTISVAAAVEPASAPFIRRGILAWINRGTACGKTGDHGRALHAFGEAERMGADPMVAGAPETRLLLVMLCVNRAKILLQISQPLAALENTRAAIFLLRPVERGDRALAEAGIKARSIQCHALALLLDEPGGAERAGDWIAEATDSAEQALALVRRTGFTDAWVADLVRYGARIYQACQPQFLGEFLSEWLGKNGPLSGDAALRAEMRNLILIACAELERKVLLLPHDTEFVMKQTEILKALQKGAAGF